MTKKGEEHKSLAYQIKRQLNDIIDVAYKDSPEDTIRQYKRFTINCFDTDMQTFLGDCRYLRDGSSIIRLLRLQNASFRALTLTAIHELAHHISRSKNGTMGHGPDFYAEYQTLVFAALDMGILTPDYLLNSDSDGRDKNKVARMIQKYHPNPVDYKKDAVKIFVTNAYEIRNLLKARRYNWNGIEQAWWIETVAAQVEAEKQYLYSIGVQEKNIRTISGSAVISRIGKTAFAYDVLYEQRHIPKQMGFRWDKIRKCWYKPVPDNVLPENERKVLIGIRARIEIR